MRKKGFFFFVALVRRSSFKSVLKQTLCLQVLVILSSCAVKPNQQELNRLENARKEAEAAEVQLKALQKERQALEAQLKEQKALLKNSQQAVDEAKSEIPVEPAPVPPDTSSAKQ